MENLKSYYVLIVGVCFIMAIFLTLFENKGVFKMVRFAFSCMLFICLISPILSGFKVPINYENIDGEMFVFDYEFAQNNRKYIYEKNAKTLEKTVKNEYNCTILVKFDTKIVKNELKTSCVYVQLTSVILKQNQTKNGLIKRVKELAQILFEVEENEVVIDEL